MQRAGKLVEMVKHRRRKLREVFNRFAVNNSSLHGENALMRIVVCPNCGANNRVDESRQAMAICGRCKRELPIAAGKPLVVTDETFASMLAEAGDKPVLVDCWAPWCGPCRLLEPIVEELAAESNGRWVIAKLNTDENHRRAAEYRIDAIPTMLIFKKGSLVDRLVGVQSKAGILERLSRRL
jgi:thioredoxin 2